ncbi:MAG: ABC transporter ATP-binding protein [Bacteroidales bacterium]|nr:ABC transporter ATP-binding protein [Bacteroidales bacterium]
MIKVLNLTKKFNGLIAVDNISFSLEKGETLILLGTSGCGKTTTLKMINRLIEATAGKVFIEGKNIQDQKPEELRKQIGYVIQSIGLFPHYTVEQNIAIVPNLLKWDKKQTVSRTREILDLVGLPPDDFLKRKPEELSGGQQQRVGLARALVADPSVVLFDEPLGALDPITRRQIQKEFNNLETLLNKTMILVTHDVFEAFELGDKICLMDGGKIKQIGTAKELIFSPQNDFVINFFQGNRYQLELMVLTLKDIMDEITKKEYKGEAVHEFYENARILDVLEAMENTPHMESILGIKSNDHNKILQTTSEAIMLAFYKKRAKLLQWIL